MEKLISVSQTVEHSSTIISDILSRILNETVMREETICRICFNLLNDIDYHLKEAQEKTGVTFVIDVLSKSAKKLVIVTYLKAPLKHDKLAIHILLFSLSIWGLHS